MDKSQYCPWCKNEILVICNDGGSFSCCGRIFHHCPNNIESIEAPDGKKYSLKSPGPSLCEYCHPRKNNLSFFR